MSKYSEGTSVDRNMHDVISKRKTPKTSLQFKYNYL